MLNIGTLKECQNDLTAVSQAFLHSDTFIKLKLATYARNCYKMKCDPCLYSAEMFVKDVCNNKPAALQIKFCPKRYSDAMLIPPAEHRVHHLDIV